MLVGKTYHEADAHPEINYHMIAIILELHRADAARGFISHHQSRIDKWLRKAGQFNDDIGKASPKVRKHAAELLTHASDLVKFEENISEHWTAVRKYVHDDAERLNFTKDDASQIMADFWEKVFSLYAASHLEFGLGLVDDGTDEDDE